jgi:hypothetical protein
MSWSVFIEIVGYLASALILFSIIQKSILRLRVLGLIGAFTFLVYSIAIGAYPIAVLNVIAAAIHLWYLRKLTRHQDEVFRILHVRPESRFLADFLDFYGDEVKVGLQPDFTHQPSKDNICAFILRDMVPAGLLIGRANDNDMLEVELDFAIPQYRDFKIGRFLYSVNSDLLTSYALEGVQANAASSDHAGYLNRMGFEELADVPGRYEIKIALTPSAN